MKIKVSNVEEEYDKISKEKCTCGGKLEPIQQTLGFPDKMDRISDYLTCSCKLCGKEYQFEFDISSFFWKYCRVIEI